MEKETVLACQISKVDLFIFRASQNPVWYICARNHVIHVQNSIPKNRCFPHILRSWSPNQMPCQKSTMATTVNSESLFINKLLKFFTSCISEVNTILDILLPNMSQKLIQIVLSISNRASIIHDQQVVS